VPPVKKKEEGKKRFSTTGNFAPGQQGKKNLNSCDFFHERKVNDCAANSVKEKPKKERSQKLRSIKKRR